MDCGLVWGLVCDLIFGLGFGLGAVQVAMAEFLAQRSGYAQGMGGLPIVGDPDHVAAQLADLSKAGLTGIGISLVNYLNELPYFCAEVMGRLERMGLREKA